MNLSLVKKTLRKCHHQGMCLRYDVIDKFGGHGNKIVRFTSGCFNHKQNVLCAVIDIDNLPDNATLIRNDGVTYEV